MSLLSSIEESITAFRNGEFIIVLDFPDRENEGDLIIAAHAITTEKMAFMIRYTSGYVCTPLPSATADALALPPMVPPDASTDPNQTAYTVTVDAVDDTVSTGISAHDRALTCRRLAEPGATAAAFRRPGHILPLRARDGGVRERQGHTEAAVEFCRLAGCEREVGVICELVEDGEQEASATEIRGSGMMRRDGCLRFAEKWGLKVCTIEDLVKYVEREQQ